METGRCPDGADTIIGLDDGETAVVGFGLLLAKSTLDKTLSRSYDGPFVRCHVEGWCRSWDVGMPNAAFYYEDRGERIYPEHIVYLNVRREPGSLMNCTVFVLDRVELGVLNGREWIYEGLDVAGDLRGVEVRGGPALMNVARPEHLLAGPASRERTALRRSYIEMFDRVLESLDSDVEAAYVRTTDPVPAGLVIDDHLDPDRPNPWAAAGHDFDPDSQQAPD